MSAISLGACKSDPLKEKALAELNHTLATKQEFVKVHAAEYLIWLGYPEKAREIFLRENELHGSQPKYRILIWRVLSETETNPEKKKTWDNKVYQAFGDLNGPDRLHAAETLAKLKLSPLSKYPEATRESVNDSSRNMQVYTHWALSYSPGADTNKYRHDFLQIIESDSNQIARIISAFVIRKMKGLTPDEWTKLASEALAEPDTSGFKHNLLNTAFVTFPDGMKKAAEYEKIRLAITENYKQFTSNERIELSQALAEKGEESDIPLLTSFLKNENTAGIYEADTKEGADVRAAAAYAILKIKKRVSFEH
jgi:hypothetical protein